MQRVRQRFVDRRHTPFPNDEIYSLTDDYDLSQVLHGELDVYLAGIAGYSISLPGRFANCSDAELLEIEAYLSKPFFSKFPEFAPFQSQITEEQRAVLLADLEAAELNRVDLLSEIQRLLRERGVGARGADPAPG